MIRKTALATILFVSLTPSWAMPKKFEVWFLTAEKSAYLEQLLEQIHAPSALVAQNLKCEPMGDYCFDPQIGLYKPGDQHKTDVVINAEILDDTAKQKEPGSASSLDRQMINCEGDSFFDIFCGSASPSKKSEYKMELWIDFSGSMKQVDFISHDQPCERETFLRSMVKKCGFNQKMKVRYFNETIKEAGRIEDACLNVGLNEPDRIMRELRESNAQHVIIITDIFEAQEKFINFIDANGGTHKGLNSPLYPKGMHKLVDKASKRCE